MILEHWGATDDEVNGPMVVDDLLPDARLVATRAISVDAPTGDVFAWLRQMGFGRAGWYSYDLLDNLGRRSARRILPEWQFLSTGDTVPGGPADFTALVVDPPRTLVLGLAARRRERPGGRQKIFFVLGYELRDEGVGTRLVTRVRARIDTPGGRFVERFLLGPGDGVMLRRQLLNVAERAALNHHGR